MKLTIRFSALLLLCVLAPNTGGHQITRPSRAGSGPETLERMAQEMSSRPVQDTDLRRLIAAFTRTAIQSARSTENEFIEGEGAFWKLLESQFPDLLERNGDLGLSYTRAIRYFHSLPEYRTVIDEILKGERTNGTWN